ncbi:copper resistance D family protein [Paenibacillus radicis (ex Gao et al. 2016)]|uniref:Copper resistance protein D domain-containing protein n=1 Tax=Paenibacillus radicis (ex Gao et al. 2016) TaxID=1737354 RepID=A0A917M1H6_9BACL|nr:CopD family protein [Paenibacillus radicis (ex Gao et al. 2016)]GGG70553.1 hypothetical protein GCM10010918_27380 [Paenibacillus radicis (ex Gao et al. 2016)]
MFYIVGDFLLYCSIALLTGMLLLNLVPEKLKPATVINRLQLTWLTAAVVVFSSLPVVKLILFFVLEMHYKLDFVTFRVLRDYNVGHGWLLTVVFAGFFVALLYQKIEPEYEKSALWIQLVLAIGMTAGIGYASHSSGLYGFKGFVMHFLHILAITIWLGSLLAAAWLTRHSANWAKWLGWMTPLSIISFILALASGIGVMFFLSDKYAEGLVVSFGQALLIKHALLLPLMALAFTNGFMLRKRLIKDPGYNPIPWLRIESVFALLVFLGTAVLSQQSPPHNMKESLLAGELPTSSLWSLFQSGAITESTSVGFQLGWISVICGILAIFMAILGTWLMKKQGRWPLVIAFLLVSAVLMYLSVMFGVQISPA